MSFTKRFLKSKPVCNVTFKLSQKEAQGAQNVSIAGDFNQWDMIDTPMKRLKNGAFTHTMPLDVGKQYQFRYLLDGDVWENDWQADDYIPSPISADDNSVISTLP